MSKTPTTLVKDGITVTTTVPAEVVSLRAQGFKDPAASKPKAAAKPAASKPKAAATPESSAPAAS